MRLETLHAPAGIEMYVCPKCCLEFQTLFSFNKHVRDKHPQPVHTPREQDGQGEQDRQNAQTQNRQDQ